MIKKIQKTKFLCLIIFLAILFFPLVSLAGSYQADGYTVIYEGLVPCGKEVDIDGTPTDMPCQFCHFFVMIDGILDFIITTIVPIIAVLMILIAGIMFIFAYLGGIEVLPGGGKGGPKLLSQAKKTLNSVVTGLIIIFAAWIIVNTFFLVIGVAETDFGTGIKNWFQINCPIIIGEAGGSLPPCRPYLC